MLRYRPDANIKLCYFGGSGGFIVFHLLLLSKQFHCEFFLNKSIDDVVDNQWNIKNPDEWKSTETWPENELTHRAETNKRKIYFFCNPTIEEISKFNGQTIFLYTDVKAQLNLAFFKKAYTWNIKNKFMPKSVDEYIANSKHEFNGDKIGDPVFAFLKHADKTINLKDVISDLNVLTSITRVPVNQRQIDLRNKWISLHPPELLKELGFHLPYKNTL